MIRKIVKVGYDNSRGMIIIRGPKELLDMDINSVSELGWNIVSSSACDENYSLVIIEKDSGTYR